MNILIPLILLIIFCILLLIICLGIGFFQGVIHGAPFVPTNIKTLSEIINQANIKPGQKVYDLGSGDGRIVFAAAKKGAHATGIEVSFFVHIFAVFRKYFLRSKATLLRKNIFDHNFSDADIVFCYLLPGLMKKVAPKLEKELPSGAKVICHAFELPGWKILKKIPYDKAGQRGSVIIYEKQ